MAKLAYAPDFVHATSLVYKTVHCQQFNSTVKNKYAGMAKLAYAPDLGSGGAIRAGSTPVTRTITNAAFVIIKKCCIILYH